MMMMMMMMIIIIIIVISGDNNVVLFKVLEPRKHTSDLFEEEEAIFVPNPCYIDIALLSNISYQLSQPSVIYMQILHSLLIPLVVVKTRGVKVPSSIWFTLSAYLCFFSSPCSLKVLESSKSLYVSLKNADHCFSQNPPAYMSILAFAALFAPLLRCSLEIQVQGQGQGQDLAVTNTVVQLVEHCTGITEVRVFLLLPLNQHT